MSSRPDESLAALESWAAPRRAAVEAWLLARFDDAWPPHFQGACRYPLQTGGKRVRPLLTIAAAEALGAPLDDALVGAAAAVELVHTYSLVHDDLPSMDDDDERRGAPAVHVAYTEGTAVLVGDALLTEAFRTLASLELPADRALALVGELASAAGHVGMIGGQAADIGLGGPVEDLDALLAVHRGKTGALIRAAARIGAVAAGATATQLDAITRYAEAVGLAFQLADDALDAEQDASREDGGPPSTVTMLGLKRTAALAQALLVDALEAVEPLPSPAALCALARFSVERSV